MGGRMRKGNQSERTGVWFRWNTAEEFASVKDKSWLKDISIQT